MGTTRDRGEVLGWGSFAKVYRTWDELLDRPVAVKELVQPFAGSEAFVRSYFAKALRMLDVSHPNLLAIFSTEADRFPPSLTREMAEQPLAYRLFDGPLEPQELVRLLRQVLTALDAVHSRDLVHLSVRPENLFWAGGVYKLGDFGVIPPDGAPPTPPRHHRYAAPEILSAEPQPSPAADLYSLGITAWELLLGTERLERSLEHALERAGGADRHDRHEGDRLWLEFHRSGAELPPIHTVEPTVPVALSLALERLARKDPAERPQSAGEAAAAIGAIEIEEAAAQTSAGSVRLAAGSPDGSMWIGIGVLFALVLAGAAFWFGVEDRMATRGGRGAETSLPEVPAEEAPVAPLEEAAVLPREELSGSPAMPGAVPDLAAELRRRAGRHSGLRFGLEGSATDARVRLPFDTRLRFRVASDRPAHLVLFTLAPDRTLTCLYPAPGVPAPTVTPGRELILPRREDEAAGFELITGPPEGTDLVFLLATDRPLPALPPGEEQGWVTEYAFRPHSDVNPALGFIRWLDRLRARDSGGVRLAMAEIEVVDGN